MSCLSSLLAVALFLPGADADKPAPLRYLRQVEDQFVRESEITRTPDENGTVFVSKTTRGKETMTLTLHYDSKDRLIAAEVVQETEKGKKTAKLKVRGEQVELIRDTAGKVADFYKVAADPIVTTAPDWSDIFQLVRRYDTKKGGKQAFAGVWFHPTEKFETPSYSIERVGSDTIAPKDKPLVLDRFRVKLRKSDYLVWADDTGRVCKLLSLGPKPVPVVLEGFEETTRELGK